MKLKSFGYLPSRASHTGLLLFLCARGSRLPSAATIGCKQLVEPNLSLFDTTPIAWGLQQIYKKRWISRYFQECGIKIYADLNVAQKFYEYNQMGIPDGYNAFFTRGYSERLEYLKAEHEIARRISGKDIPNLLVYGGGKDVRDYCVKNSLVYVEQLMVNKNIKKRK